MKAPCQGCDKRLIGCHSVCQVYHAWRAEYEKAKAAKHKETSSLSRSMQRHIWRKMMGR